MRDSGLLGFDVGNTRVKAAVLVNGRVTESQWAVHGSDEDLQRLVQEFAVAYRNLDIAIASVNSSVSDRLIRALEDHGLAHQRIFYSDGSLFQQGLLRPGVETPASTGVDRILSAVAALERSAAGAVVVVDCGSAVTVNLTTRDRVFQGGAIFAGPGIMASALHRGTALLPNVPVGEKPPALGRSTTAAIGAGVFYSIVGGIDRLIDEIVMSGAANIPNEKANVFLTGGAAPILSAGIRTPHVYSQFLVLEGLWHAVAHVAERTDEKRS
ncbi:MAG: type III pantothenate kinase [Planctomycetota bacterium]